MLLFSRFRLAIDQRNEVGDVQRNPNSLKNLEKGKATQFKAGDKAASIAASNGGKKSQQVQKEKRDASTYAKMVLSLTPKMPDPVERMMKDIGIKTKKPDAKLIAICSQMRMAMAGDQKALEFLLDIAGEDLSGGSMQTEDPMETIDEQKIMKKLDAMSDDQLRSYQELCAMFEEEGEGVE